MNEQLTRSDIRTMARKAADYITFNCDGVSEGFEITHKGYTIFGPVVQRRAERIYRSPRRMGPVGPGVSGDRRSLAINVELTD